MGRCEASPLPVNHGKKSVGVDLLEETSMHFLPSIQDSRHSLQIPCTDTVLRTLAVTILASDLETEIGRDES